MKKIIAILVCAMFLTSCLGVVEPSAITGTAKDDIEIVYTILGPFYPEAKIKYVTDNKKWIQIGDFVIIFRETTR